MILVYAFICTLIFSHYLAKLYKAWESLHIGLIKASMYKQILSLKKSGDPKASLSGLFSLYPKTWRSLWSELMVQGDGQEFLVPFALRTGLRDYCLVSKSKNLVSQAENITVLCLTSDQEARTTYLSSLSEDSDVWQIPILSECFDHGDVATTYIKCLLSLHQPRKASHILSTLSSLKAKAVIVDICRVKPDFRSFAVAAGAHLESSDQVSFLLEALNCGVEEVHFIKYYARYNLEGQSLLRASFARSSWWYSRYILNPSGDESSPPRAIAWFYSRKDLGSGVRPEPSLLPDIEIAA